MVPGSDPNGPEESGEGRKREERHPAYTDTPCGTKKKRASSSRQEEGAREMTRMRQLVERVYRENGGLPGSVVRVVAVRIGLAIEGRCR